MDGGSFGSGFFVGVDGYLRLVGMSMVKDEKLVKNTIQFKIEWVSLDSGSKTTLALTNNYIRVILPVEFHAIAHPQTTKCKLDSNVYDCTHTQRGVAFKVTSAGLTLQHGRATPYVVEVQDIQNPWKAGYIGLVGVEVYTLNAATKEEKILARNYV